jgi:hypothetical protein
LEVPGLYIVEIESPRLGASLLGKPQSMFVPTSVLVTNLSVHFKWGREASLIWVTTLDEGRPVHEAQVAVHDCKGQTLWAGATDNQGIARVGMLPLQEALAACPYEGNLPHYDSQQTLAINRLDGGLFVTAALANDFSFAHSSWDRGICRSPMIVSPSSPIQFSTALCSAPEIQCNETHPAGADAARVLQRAR